MKHRLDCIDHKILNLLQENARMTLKEIASKVFLSSPATSARMERLEKEGYITGFHASVNREMMGYNIKAFINVVVDAKLKEEFINEMQQCKNVIECNCITGDYAMLIEVIHASTEELERFVCRLQKYGKTQTQIVYSTAVEHRELLPDPDVAIAG